VIEAMGAGRCAARGMKAWLGLRDTDFVYRDEQAAPDVLLFGIDRAEHGYTRVRLPR
jgi:glutamate synthase (NADPH/NADH) small chain